MPPINTIVVQTILLPKERRNATVLEQAQKLLTKSLVPIDDALRDKDFLIGDFSGADVMLGHACYMANRMGRVTEEMPNLSAYVQRISDRPHFKTAIKMK